MIVIHVFPSKSGEIGGIHGVVDELKRYFSVQSHFTVRYMPTCAYGRVRKDRKLFEFTHSFLKLLQMLLKDKIDIIHFHSSSGFSFYRKFICLLVTRCVRPHIRTVFHIHSGYFVDFYSKSLIKRRMVALVLAQSDAVIVLSQFLRMPLCSNFPFADTKIHVLPNPVNISDYLIRVNKQDFSEERIVLLYVGRISKAKGIREILDSIPLIVQAHPQVQFCFAGNGDVQMLLDSAVFSKYQANVSFLGWIEGKQKLAVFSSAHIFLYPSHKEGFGRAIVEAMAAGLIVIASRVGGIPEIIKHEENGFLINRINAEEIAHTVNTLLTCRDKMEQISRAAQKRALDFDTKFVGDSLSRIYHSLSRVP